jgi:thioredoxin-related protein
MIISNIKHRITFTSLFFLLCVLSRAQNTGMQFYHNESWKNILEKAKASNKFIFVDCYATWCGPCKKMSVDVFPQKEVGDFYNAHYVSVKAQMDSSAKDNEDIRARYNDNHMLLTKYGVLAYPTYLVFNPEGELVQKFVGYLPAKEFIINGEDALKPEKQYYTQLRRFERGDRSPAFLFDLAQMAHQAMDKKNGELVFGEYLKTNPDIYTKENIRLILSYTKSTRDKGFVLMMEEPEKVDAVMGKNTSALFIVYLISKDELKSSLFSKAPDSLATSPDWTLLRSGLEKKYPKYAQEVMASNKVNFYQYNKQWIPYGPAISYYMQNYSDRPSYQQLNQYAWEVYENCAESGLIAQALEWSKKSMVGNEDYACIDTYAHLLMKTGKKPEAIEWETKAVNMAREKNDPDLSTYENELKKMEAK